MKYQAESIDKPKGKVWGGVRLPHFKDTADSESIELPVPDEVSIPLKQNIGAACEPLVNVGDQVFVGTKIGDTDKFMSAPIHSSVSGKVKAITEKRIGGEMIKCVVITSDKQMTQAEFSPIEVKTPQDVVNAARECGLVGLGGAGFPAHIKLMPAGESKIDTLIVNAAECEPYITSDYRTCMEEFDDVIDGVFLLRDIFDFKKVILAVEANKPMAIKKLYEIATDKRDYDDRVRVMRLKTTYPQGAEKMLVYNTTKRKIPFGKLPADVGCVVMNVTSVAVLNRYIRTGRPLVSKRLTVDGDGIGKPQNLIVPIGAYLDDILQYCEVKEDVVKVLLGGPMMGNAVSDTNNAVSKQNNAILAFSALPQVDTTPCIRCGSCVKACPMNLMPASVEEKIRHGLTDDIEKLNVNYCIECGSCSYVCPAYRPLTQTMRVAKNILRGQKNAK